jgi:hypothetical protein
MYELAYSTWDFDVFIVVALMNYLSLYCIVLYCIVFMTCFNEKLYVL